MATLVSDIINEAFLDLAAIDPGVGITTAEQTDAFLRLNQMIGVWSTEQFSVFGATHTGLTVTAGTAAYTVGTGGSLVTAARPVRITGAAGIAGVAGSFRAPIEVVSFDEFAARVRDPFGQVSVMPEIMAADQGFPSINIKLFPTPAASPATLWLDYWVAIAAFATVGDTVTLPPGYEDALHFNLALRLYPQYPRNGNLDTLMALAKESKDSLMQLNAQILGQQPAAPAPAKGQ